MTSQDTMMNDKRTSLMTIADRLEKASGPDNRLDCEIDIALFAPDRDHASVRMNAAGTKLAYTRHDGRTDTYRSQDHTMSADRREAALSQVRAAIAAAEVQS